jgi:NADH dehydrogenase FAD-containing subunit
VVPEHEHKAFIPYSHAFKQPTIPNPDLHHFIKAKVLSVYPHHLELDREWKGTKRVDFDHLVLATGTKLPSPGSMQSDEKKESIGYFKTYQAGVQRADKIVIIGGGAVGVQMATDLKEVYPEKTVTLVQSRKTVMPKYHPKLHEIIKQRFDVLGVDLITENRVVVPSEGFPLDGSDFDVELRDGRKIPAQLIILATGQIANNQLLHSLEPSTSEVLVNPTNGFIRVKPTLQFKDPAYGHMYALGDIADTGAHKAARPGVAQAGVVTKNILSAIEGKEVESEIEIGPAGIHMSLGLVGLRSGCDMRSTVSDPVRLYHSITDGESSFPKSSQGRRRSRGHHAHRVSLNRVSVNPSKVTSDEPLLCSTFLYIFRHDLVLHCPNSSGSRDMNIESVWTRRGVIVNGIEDYHL